MEDISDTKLEKYLQKNTAAKWFCNFCLMEKDSRSYVYYQRIRIGTNKLSKIFNLLKKQLKKQGLMTEIFTFVDASHLTAKANL